jgi:hypothetical protein
MRVRHTSAALVFGVIEPRSSHPCRHLALAGQSRGGDSAHRPYRLDRDPGITAPVVGGRLRIGIVQQILQRAPTIDSNWLAVYLDQGWFGLASTGAPIAAGLPSGDASARLGVLALFLVSYCAGPRSPRLVSVMRHLLLKGPPLLHRSWRPRSVGRQ